MAKKKDAHKIEIDPMDGITAEEVSAAARILRGGEQPAPFSDVSTGTVEEDNTLGEPVDESLSELPLDEDQVLGNEPPAPVQADNVAIDFLPRSCPSCGANGPMIVIVVDSGKFSCAGCRHTWTLVEEQAPFRRYLRQA